MRPISIRITKIVNETPSVKTFFFDKSFDSQPGQFVMVWIRGVDEIPMALSYDNAITVQRVGDATSALFKLGRGGSFGIRGPYGKGFNLSGENILLITGGVGAAPLAPLAEKAGLKGIKTTVLLGAKSRDELLFTERFKGAGKLYVATEDGSLGSQGFVTQLLGEIELDDYDHIYTCGPEPMMAKVLESLPKDLLTRAEFSLHRYIKCGLGLCGACCINGLRVCRDGPVFRGDQLISSEFGRYTRDACGRRIGVGR